MATFIVLSLEYSTDGGGELPYIEFRVVVFFVVL